MAGPPGSGHAWVLVTGHPYVDIWQAVKPTRSESEWPVVPRGLPWKDGICAALGVVRPAGACGAGSSAAVNSYADVEVALLRAVEELIDFVTE